MGRSSKGRQGRRAVIGLTALLALGTAHSEPQALIIGVGEYVPIIGAPKLSGVAHDMASATRIAKAMGVAEKDIHFLRDHEATKEGVLRAIAQLGDTSTQGSKNLVYYSGHGTRYWDDTAKGCVEGLLTHDGLVISNAELAQATRRLFEKSDKVVSIIDACYSEGVASSRGSSTRSLNGSLSAKFFPKGQDIADLCSQPSNYRTRSLFGETTRLGALKENVVQITSSRPDEVSFDEPGRGGIATQALRDCLLGQARDLDGSGAISLAEIQQCAQEIVDRKLSGMPDVKPHHVTVSGNRNLIPVQAAKPLVAPPVPAMKPVADIALASAPTALSNAPAVPPGQAQSGPTQATATSAAVSTRPETAAQGGPTPPAPAAPTASATSSEPSGMPPSPATPPATPPATSPATPPALASLATLQDILAQRDPRISVEVKLARSSLRIGRDPLAMQVQSSVDGFVYLVLLGSDRKSFYVLFPNGLDGDNRIQAGQPMKLPRANWELVANGPKGIDHVLVMVAESPRKLDGLAMAAPSAKNPFSYALNDLGGRMELIRFLTDSSERAGSARFGASLSSVRELP